MSENWSVATRTAGSDDGAAEASAAFLPRLTGFTGIRVPAVAGSVEVDASPAWSVATGTSGSDGGAAEASAAFLPRLTGCADIGVSFSARALAGSVDTTAAWSVATGTAGSDGEAAGSAEASAAFMTRFTGCTDIAVSFSARALSGSVDTTAAWSGATGTAGSAEASAASSKLNAH